MSGAAPNWFKGVACRVGSGSGMQQLQMGSQLLSVTCCMISIATSLASDSFSETMMASKVRTLLLALAGVQSLIQWFSIDVYSTAQGCQLCPSRNYVRYQYNPLMYRWLAYLPV